MLLVLVMETKHRVKVAVEEVQSDEEQHHFAMPFPYLSRQPSDIRCWTLSSGKSHEEALDQENMACRVSEIVRAPQL